MPKMPTWLSRILPSRHIAKRRFDAAQYNRFTSSFTQSDRSINTELRADLDALRRRARDLAKNEPLAAKYLEMVTTNVVGSNGFSLQARVADIVKNADGTFGPKQDGLANTAIEAAWADWSKASNCDVSGRMSFPDMTRAIIRGVARDGEALVRIREGANNKYGYALQFLDIERLDTTLNREQAPNVNQIIMGIEMDTDGRPLAYWLLAAPIGRDPVARKPVRIDAAEIIHLFITDDPEQVRGIPWMHASMIRIHHLKGFQEAAIIAARVGASKMGFFTNKDGNTAPLADGEDAAGVPFTEAEPGQFGMLPEGYGFESFNPDYPHANYESFVKGAKRDIGSGFGAAYHTLANDLEGVNFSSIRSGTLEERDGWMLIQRWLVGALLDQVYAQWMDNALLSGAILLPNGSPLPAAKRQKFMAHEFQGRRWQWVDPMKDIQAAVIAMENGLGDPYTIASQQGVDAEDVLDGIARFQEYAKARGVKLGSATPAAQTPAAAAEPDEDDTSQTQSKKTAQKKGG
jgi:lambda family phage portal protein